MAKLFKKTAKVGQPPGTLIYIGEKEAKPDEFSLLEYEADLRESALKDIDRCLVLSPDHVAWLNVNGLADVKNLEKIGECFHIHHLILEHILNTDQRPKLEDMGDYLYLVLKMLHYNAQGELAADQVSLVFGKNYLISLHENEQDLFNAIRERLKAKGRLRRLGADYLAYSIVDLIVDHYFLILERLGETIEDIEERAQAEMKLAAPNVRVTIQSLLNNKDEAGHTLLQNNGYAPVRYWWRMEIKLQETPAAVPFPAGIELRAFIKDEHAVEVWQADNAAFLDHWGSHNHTYEEWSIRANSSSIYG